MLVENEIDSARITPIGYGFRNPVITNEMLLDLNSRTERDEANQRNRRVEIKVVAIKPED
jgi:outer membrane protein OmpA-like peptidoglycan-associated protein